MNLIILHSEEVDPQGTAILLGRRAEHIRTVLKGRVEQQLRVGMLNGQLGTGIIRQIGPEEIVLKCSFDEEPPPEPTFSLLLALPRPKVLKRMWAPLASLGVGHIILTNAAKVERNYFDTHWIQEEYIRPLLIEGLEQAGDTRLPRVTVTRRLKPFIEDELDARFPNTQRLLAHPTAGNPITSLPSTEPALLAVGPEGGWTPFELELFEAHGFSRVSLGPRRLRTDVACIALISACRMGQHTDLA